MSVDTQFSAAAGCSRRRGSLRGRFAAIIAVMGVIGTAVLTPTAVFAAPMVVDDAYTLGAAAPFTSAPGSGLLANDNVDIPGAFVKVQAKPLHGAVTEVQLDGTFNYTPIPAFVGTDSFTYCLTLSTACVTGEAAVSMTVVPHLERIGAADRFGEAAAISHSTFSAGVDYVFVASGAVFPDALSAGAASGTLSAPILLVTKDSIPNVVKDELARLIPGKIILLGGVDTVTAEVELELQDYAPVKRIAGADRYEVSAGVSAFAFPPVRSVAYVASGEVFPDALSASAAAGLNLGPVLLVQKNAVPRSITFELDRLKPARIVVLGGSATISDSVLAALRSVAPTVRVSGADRYAVSASASANAFDPKEARVVYIASGENFPDALAGSPAAIVRDSPVLLVSKNAISDAVAAELDRIKPVRIVVLGGTSSISPQVEADLAAHLAH